ncbi:kelch-like protein 23 isoform X2 [Styela clava]
MNIAEERFEDVFQDEIVRAFPRIVDFKRFARSRYGLCLSQDEIEDIVNDCCSSTEEQKLQMLYKWKQNTGRAGTISKIRSLVHNFLYDDRDQDSLQENTMILRYNRNLSIYSPATGTWDELKKLSNRTSRYSIVVLNLHLYALTSTETYRLEFSEPTANWEKTADLIHYHGNIYVCGGSDLTSIQIVQKYDPEYDKWQNVARMKLKRSDHGIVSARGKIYCFGSKTGTDDSYRKGEVYDSQRQTWKFTAPMKRRALRMSAAEVEGLIYVAEESDFHCYDIKRDSWQTIILSNQWPNFHCDVFHVLALNNEIYIIGTDSINNDALHKYDRNTSSINLIHKDPRFLAHSCDVANSG